MIGHAVPLCDDNGKLQVAYLPHHLAEVVDDSLDLVAVLEAAIAGPLEAEAVA